MIIVGTMYFYITLHDLMWMNFELNWLKCDLKNKNKIYTSSMECSRKKSVRMEIKFV